jgi:hypothetical protein
VSHLGLDQETMVSQKPKNNPAETEYCLRAL